MIQSPIFNLLRLSEVETDKDDRPLDPAPILSVEVLWNPFQDIVPRVSPKTSHVPVSEAKEPSKKATKKLNLLSFGEEAEEEEKQLAAVKQKKCSHDVLNNPRLLKAEATNKERNASEDKKPKMEKLSFKRKGIVSEAKAKRMENGDADLQLYNGSERARQLHKLKKRRLQGNEDAKLEKFKQSIAAKPFASSSEPEDIEEDVSDWRNDNDI